ncbi:hypothetical protein [Bradyrhizobium neotropicale]|uniref:hypothetical protein n=1 Tax=Bradyrhizobium neotropicale TaxID=1497615 RepID=UPI001AD70C50|nr:hypothetical protein [Bradyrhizobium neotropicale]
MQPLSNLPQKLKSAQVVVRFVFRLLILTGFALFGSIGFGRSFIALLWMSTVLCAVIALMRREQFMDADLNHWDEMAAYAALCALASATGR